MVVVTEWLVEMRSKCQPVNVCQIDNLLTPIGMSNQLVVWLVVVNCLVGCCQIASDVVWAPGPGRAMVGQLVVVLLVVLVEDVG